MIYLRAGFLPYFTQDFFQSHWQVTQRCNFHCPYCVNKHLRTEGVHMSREVFRTALHYIADLKRSSYRFSISGGESTLFPHLEELLSTIEKLFPEKSTINILTNGSASTKRMRQIISCAPSMSCRFIISIHLGQIHLPALIDKLCEFTPLEQKKYFLFKIIAPPDDLQCEKIKIQLESAKIYNYRLQPVIDFATGCLASGYTDAELDQFNILPPGQKEFFIFDHVSSTSIAQVSFLEGIRKNLFHYTNMFCSAGYQSIYIDEYGLVSKGQFCGHMGYSVLEKNPFDDCNFYNPSPCSEPHCTCIPFTSLPKWSDNSYAPSWYTKNI